MVDVMAVDGGEGIRRSMQRLRLRMVLCVCFPFWEALALDLGREAIIM